MLVLGGWIGYLLVISMQSWWYNRLFLLFIFRLNFHLKHCFIHYSFFCFVCICRWQQLIPCLCWGGWIGCLLIISRQSWWYHRPFLLFIFRLNFHFETLLHPFAVFFFFCICHGNNYWSCLCWGEWIGYLLIISRQIHWYHWLILLFISPSSTSIWNTTVCVYCLVFGFCQPLATTTDPLLGCGEGIYS